MEKLVAVTTGVLSAEPAALVAIVSIVALVVLGECVRQFCKALGKGKE